MTRTVVKMQGDQNFEGGNNVLDSLFSPGFNKKQEMSAMVAALTHVVAGDVKEEVLEAGGGSVGGGGTGVASSTSARSWSVGDKRGREEQMNEQFSEPVPTICSEYSNFSIGSSSTGTGRTYSKFISLFFVFVTDYYTMCM